MTERKTLWGFLAVFALLLFIELPGAWLFDPDEPRYAEIPVEMLATGDFLTPRLNGSHYFEKPPLLYWLSAAAIKIGGAGPYAARMTTRLATLATAAALLLLLRGSSPTTTFSLWTALIYLSSLLPFVMGRLNTMDSLITFAMTLTMLSFRSYVLARETGQSGGAALTLLGVGLALGMLAKGLIGVVLPGLVIFFWCATTKAWGTVRDVIFSRASVLFVVIAAPWFLLMEKAHPGFLFFFFVHEHLLRFATASANRPGPASYFIPVVIFGLLPWTLFLIPALKKLWKDRDATFAHTRDELFFGIWFAVVVVFFSLSKSKLIPYVLPAFPAAAALVATAIPVSRHHIVTRMMVGVAALYLALIIAQPRLARKRLLHEMAVQASATNARWIVAYKTYPQSLRLVAGRPVIVAGFQGELASDNVLDPTLFWTPTRFRHMWSSTETVTAVFRQEQWPRLPRHTPAHVIFRGGDWIVASNFAPDQTLEGNR